MIFPNDIWIRETQDGTKVWISQRLILQYCGISADYLRDKARFKYKKSLPPSWQKVTQKTEFVLGDNGRSWRWGYKSGQYYYDYDRIPNKKPTCYRDKLPSKEELIAWVAENDLTTKSARVVSIRKELTNRVDLLTLKEDISFFQTFPQDEEKKIFDLRKSLQLARSVAWCCMIQQMVRTQEYLQLGIPTLKELVGICQEILQEENLEGLRLNTYRSVRKKMLEECPEDRNRIREYLISGKYGNSNSRKIGKHKLVDYSTGEILAYDEHETIILNYWLNPGGASKGTKKELYDEYVQDMQELGMNPLSFSTFTHYTNTWANQVLSSKERHGKKVSDDKYRPYVPAQPLNLANSLWASDGSGIVPYRYRKGKEWKAMKLYVMMITDVGSKCIVGYSVSKKATHTENFPMLRTAMQMALLKNGRTEVLDFISDNHGAYTSDESKAYLKLACRSVRTIQPGMSQANPAETIFRLFKRRFKRYFNLPETSWNARGLDSLANPDYFNVMELPQYEDAIAKLETAIRDWNKTKLSNGLTPEEWFEQRKNPKAKPYDELVYRQITGHLSKKNLSYHRGTMILERAGVEYSFEVPTDSQSIALIAQYMGYSSSFSAQVYWNPEGADIYSPDGKFMFTCPPTERAAKSPSEATSETSLALHHHTAKADEFDDMIDDFVEGVQYSTDVLIRNYGHNIQASGTKEDYNEMMDEISAAKLREAAEEARKKELAARMKKKKQEAKSMSDAALKFKKKQISDMSKYLK